MTDTSTTPPATDYDADLSLALRLADAADAISASRFRANDLHIETKPDRTHVTDADRAVEQAVRDILAAERPDDAVLGEEFGEAGDSSRRWIIDPIDGTHNFERGVPLWGTLIALAVDSEVVVGVASMPAIRQRWWAIKDGGAWTTADGGTARRLHVSGIADLADASISFQSIEQWDEAGYLQRLIDLTRSVWRDRGYGDLWPYTLVAEGLLEAVGEFGVKQYDVAPLSLLVTEAGGRFSAVTGESGYWHGSSLATNGLLHDEIVARLR
ncbi:inositol monophosphatase family protein [Gryllotalpicola sp.]|uniref:inositol monophosphatase family protein n=1 Tax=Gryllotalpicola sp. TaxID=1932787 RepID=UPI002607316C|nr:inositol monophosphatase family protein [Gryllotalpicola sp.]